MKGVSTAKSFQQAAHSLETALTGSVRQRIVVEVLKSRSFDRSVRHLREGMRNHRFEGGGEALFSGTWAKHLDHMTRAEGFHILNDWDGKADRFCDDTIPVEVASFIERVADPADEAGRRNGLAILLDYYFLHLLALLAMRVWDDDAPSASLDRVDQLLRSLQGAGGSGQKFARDAGTLILIATSHFEPDVTAYERLLAKVRRLDQRHRLNIALTHAAILGSHLRFGLEVTCAGSVAALRDDNVPDYPWLCEAVATLLESAEHDDVDEALLIALSADPEALLSPAPPAALDSVLVRRAQVREVFLRRRDALLQAFQSLQRTEGVYSPLAFTFNFPHNLVKGITVDAVLRGSPWALGLDDLLISGVGSPDIDAQRSLLAGRLMAYAIASPDTIRGQPHPAIVYDPRAGAETFERTMARLRAF
ncbi:MAG: hypothetical protein ABIR28_14410 [Vicinamibacteria bacterium]